MLLKNYFKAVGLALAIVYSVVEVSASEVDMRDSIVSKKLENITVSANKVTSKVSTATSVQVLNSEDLRNFGLQDVGEAVKRFAGANVKDYGGIGGLKTVSVRNLGAAHTAVSYDGVAVSNCQAGQIDVGRFSLDNVSELSLAVGQDDNMLQSARLQSSAGVLKIETQKPYFEDKNYLTELKIKGGAFGYISPTVRHWQKLSNVASVTLNANFQRADGYYPYVIENGQATKEEKRQNSDVKSYQGELNYYHTFCDDDELNVKAYYFNSERGLPGSVILYNPQSDERLWDENFFVQARYKKFFSSKLKMLIQGKYNYSWNKYLDEGVEYEGGKQIDINKQNEYYLSATVLYSLLNGLDVSLAQDGAVNKLNTNGVNSPEPLRYTSLTAFSVQYKYERLKLMGSLLATYITDEVQNGNTPEDRSKLSPTVMLSYRLLPEQQFYVRAMFKNTFRVPTFSDLYYLRVGNTNLKPENATEYTAGVTWSGKAGVCEYISFTIDGYFNKVTDKIIAFPSTYVWKMQNYGKVNIYGVDVTLATGVKVQNDINLNVSTNYSWQKAIDVTDKSAKNYKHQLPYTPEHSGNVALTIEMPWVNVGYSAGIVGKRYYLAQNIDVNKIDGYCEHTATVWREFKLKATSLRLQAEIINLTDSNYEVIKYYPMPGRSWRLTGIIKF